MTLFPLRWISCLSLLYGLVNAIVATPASAEVPLTRADAEDLYNTVEVRSPDGRSRRVRMTERFSSSETFQTQNAARLDLRFNDGSLARIGEHTIFRFFSDTRTLSLPQGTGLFLIPAAQGQSTIHTPGVLTEAEGAALIVRYVPTSDRTDVPSSVSSGEPDVNDPPGRTVVMALTQNAEGSIEVGLVDRRKIALLPGQMAIVDQERLYLFEFDLALFCQTSSLIADIRQGVPDDSTPIRPVGEACQVSLQKLVTQDDNFAGEYYLNPDSLDPAATSENEANWLVPTAAARNGTVGSNPRTPTLPADLLPSDSSPADTTAGETPSDAENLESDAPLTPESSGVSDPDSLPPGLITPSGPLEPPTEPPIAPPVEVPEAPENPPEPISPPSVEPPPEIVPPEPIAPPAVEPLPEVVPPAPAVPPVVESPPEGVSPEPIEPPLLEPPVAPVEAPPEGSP